MSAAAKPQHNIHGFVHHNAGRPQCRSGQLISTMPEGVRRGRGYFSAFQTLVKPCLAEQRAIVLQRTICQSVLSCPTSFKPATANVQHLLLHRRHMSAENAITYSHLIPYEKLNLATHTHTHTKIKPQLIAYDHT